MSLATRIKHAFRRFGVEVKHLDYGLDLWLDLATLFEGRTPREIFDVGANEGQTSRRLHALFPEARIHAFEPNPATYERLCASVRSMPRIVPSAFALGPEPARAALHITGSSVNASLLPYDKPGGTDAVKATAEVAVATLDEFASSHGIGAIDLLKVDTQGYDLEVLKGGRTLFREGRVRALLTEVNFVQMYANQSWFHDIYAFAHEHGLRLCGFHDVRHERKFHLQWADALFVQPEWAGERPPRRHR